VSPGATVIIELTCPEDSASIQDGNHVELISASSTAGMSTRTESGMTLTFEVTNNLNLEDLQMNVRKVCADFS